MKVSESKAREMFVSAGLPAADWTPRRLLGKLNNAVEVITNAPDKLEGEEKKLFLKVCEALQEGDEIDLDTPEEDEIVEKSAENGKAETKKAKKPAKAEKNGAEKDPFGCRVGTGRAKFNAALSREPKKMKQLMEEAGVGITYYEHSKKLIDNGWLEKSEEGYRLTKEGQKLMKKSAAREVEPSSASG